MKVTPHHEESKFDYPTYKQYHNKSRKHFKCFFVALSALAVGMVGTMADAGKAVKIKNDNSTTIIISNPAISGGRMSGVAQPVHFATDNMTKAKRVNNR